MKKYYAAAVLGALILMAAAPSRARLSDYAVRPEVSVGETVTALDFTPDGRFLVILSGLPGTVRFFDTWDMAPLTGDTAQVAVGSGNTVALSLSVSPYSSLPFAYVGLSSGEVVVIGLSGVIALDALEELTAAPALTIVDMADKPVERVLAMPEVSGNKAAVYLLATVSADPQPLKWVRLLAGNAPGTVVEMLVTRTPVEVARGKKYAYVLDRDPTGQHFLNIISCSETGKRCDPLKTSAIAHAPGEGFTGLASDRLQDNYSVTFNQGQDKEFLLENFALSVALADTFTVSDATVALAMQGTPFDPFLGDLILGAGGNTVTVASLASTGAAFGGSYKEFKAGNPLTTLAASGGTEGYAFAGAGDGGIWPFTANPWVTNLTSAVNGGTVTLTFTADSKLSGSMTFAVYKNIGFRKWPASISGNPTNPNVTTTTTFKLSELKECQNAVTLIVQDSLGRQGRAVEKVEKDSPPKAPSFKLGFGSKKLTVSFTAADLCDLDRYAIFWGDTNSQPVTDYELLASYGDSIAVESPTPGERIERAIKGLTDGKRYWVQLVVFDEDGNKAVSARQSAVPQAVNTLTEAADEDGGFDCLGSVGNARRGDPLALVGLLLPLVIYAVARGARRERR